MSEAGLTIKEQEAQREEAKALRRANVKGMWLGLKGEDPFAEHQFRRMLSVEIISNEPDLKPHVGEFLGRCAVDRNAFSEKQKAWLSRLVDEYVGIDAPKTESKSKKKSEAGK